MRGYGFAKLLPVPAVVTALVLVGCAARSAPGLHPRDGVSPSVEQTLPPDLPPLSSPPASLTTTVESKLNGFVLRPPGAVVPVVDGMQALVKAWTEEGAEGNPTSVRLTFALLSWGENVDTPVWLITYEGTCVPVGGGVGASNLCRKLPFHTLINADTLGFIASFVDSSIDI